MKKINYSEMFTLRSDGRYQGYWHEPAKDGKGTRHAICDRDPERLYQRIQEKEKPTSATFSEVLDLWEKSHRESIKERTWKNYSPHVEELRNLYGSIPVEEITAFEVTQDLLTQKAKGLSYTVVNTRRCIWRMVLDQAVADPQIRLPFNPALSVKNPKGLPKGKRTAPEDDILTAILADASDDFGFIPFFLLCTGLRRTEALQRKKSDVDLKAWEIHIPRSKTEAGIRTVPIIKPLQAPLKEWMESHPGEWLFPYIPYNGRTGTHMTDSNWETAWANYCLKKGWTDVKGKPLLGAHDLRHGTATLLYESGVDVYTAQHILGHANVTTTLAIYTDLRKKHETKNVGKFQKKIANMMAKKRK